MSPLLHHNAVNIFLLFQTMELIRRIWKKSSIIRQEDIITQEISAVVRLLIHFTYRHYKSMDL